MTKNTPARRQNFFYLAALASLLFVSCADSSRSDGVPGMTPPSAHTGQYTFIIE